MVSCCAGNCVKKTGDVSSRRKFIRFYRFPKDSNLKKRWIERIDRIPDHVKRLANTAAVCSDHFEDGDFNTSNFLKSTILHPDSLKGLAFFQRH